MAQFMEILTVLVDFPVIRTAATQMDKNVMMKKKKTKRTKIFLRNKTVMMKAQVKLLANQLAHQASTQNHLFILSIMMMAISVE